MEDLFICPQRETLTFLPVWPFNGRINGMAPIAQRTEQLPSKQWAACSSHAGGAGSRLPGLAIADPGRADPGLGTDVQSADRGLT